MRDFPPSGGGCGALTLTQIGSGGTLEFSGEGLAETGEGAPTFTPASSSAGKYLTADVGAVFEAASDAQQMILECWIKTTTMSRAILGLYSTGLDNQLVLTLSASGELVLEYTDSGGTLTTLNTADVVTDGSGSQAP